MRQDVDLGNALAGHLLRAVPVEYARRPGSPPFEQARRRVDEEPRRTVRSKMPRYRARSRSVLRPHPLADIDHHADRAGDISLAASRAQARDVPERHAFPAEQVRDRFACQRPQRPRRICGWSACTSKIERPCVLAGLQPHALQPLPSKSVYTPPRSVPNRSAALHERAQALRSRSASFRPLPLGDVARDPQHAGRPGHRPAAPACADLHPHQRPVARLRQQLRTPGAPTPLSLPNLSTATGSDAG